MACVEQDPTMQVTPDVQGNVDVTPSAAQNGYVVEYLGVPMLNSMAEAIENQENKQVEA